MKLVSRIAEHRKYPLPLLFVHGICCGSWIWEWHYLPYFSNLGYDAYAINLTGHYRSERPPNFGSLGTHEFLKDLKQAISQVPSPIVIGHSAGGFLLQKYLEGHPLQGAVLFASVGPEGLEKEVLAGRTLQQLYHRLSNPPTGPLPFFSPSTQIVRQTMFCPHTRMSEQEIEQIVCRLSGESARWVTELTLGLVRSTPPRHSSTPVLVVAPQEDFLISPGQYEALAQQYHADIYRVVQTGHAAQLDSTWAETADAVHEWIQKRVLGKGQGA